MIWALIVIIPLVVGLVVLAIGASGVGAPPGYGEPPSEQEIRKEIDSW